MYREDLNLRESDIQSLSNGDAIATFFVSLGYQVERLQQTTAALGIKNETLTRNIQSIEQIAVQDAELYIYLFVMKSMRVADRQALARAFRNAEGEAYLLILTSEFESIDFVLLERLESRDDSGNAMLRKEVLIKQHVLTVNRRNPDRVALRVLRRFTYTETDVFYQIDKLLSAYTVAAWSRPMFNNLALFSDYFLEHRLQDTDEWHEEALSIHTRLNRRFTNVRAKLGNAREEETRAQLLEPIFRELGFNWIERQSSGDEIQPDYILAQPDTDQPLVYVLTYRWNRYLDGRDMVSSDGFDNKSLDAQKYDDNPGARVVSLLAADDAPRYVIVTNGKIWRLYAKETHSRATNYYEIDLEETLTDPDRDIAIRYYWLFFRAQAFVTEVFPRKGETRALTFLDRIMMGSASYAKELEDRLKERVFEQIFPQFAEGFIRNRWGTTIPTQEELDEVYQATLTFLYRIMFLLYAEARDLLPIKDERGYLEISLKRLKEEIANNAGNLIEQATDKIKASYSPSSTELYDHLTRLFTVIDKGDTSLNMPNYNGGLFVTDPADNDTDPDSENARFLRDTKIPDRYLALGLDRLARDVEQRPGGGLVAIDFKSLGVRQLGSIYEGLLEFRLRIAPEKMAIIKGKRTEEVIPYKKAKPSDIVMEGRGKEKAEKTLSKGDVYLENTKRERKATGSYYTPDYIVKYIVQNTVRPVLKQKLDELTPRLRQAEQRYYQFRKNNEAKAKAGMAIQSPELIWNDEDMQQLAVDVLDIKVLDPAMGSGHFLVEVVDFVTDSVLQFLDHFRYNPVEAQLRRVRESILTNMDTQGVSIDEKRLTDVNLLKRQVLKRCVYGVDLNRMAVELAKVSLWLDAFTLGAPLSFLDHHLRWGNSLIGTMARDADKQLRGVGGQLTLFSGPFVGLLQAAEVMRGVSALADATIEEAHQSASLFEQFEEAARPYKQLLDVFVIQHFGVKLAREFLDLYGAGVMTAQHDKLGKGYQAVLDEREALYIEYRFFHWDLEFPEVFIDLSQAEWKQSGGFDAVVGNPPYVRQEELKSIKDYFADAYAIYQSTADLYLYFFERSLRLLQEDKLLGFITSGTYMNTNSATAFRQYIHNNAALDIVLNFGENQPFIGAEMVYPTISVLRHGKPNETFRSKFLDRVIPLPDLDVAIQSSEGWEEALSYVTHMDEWRFQDRRLTELFQKLAKNNKTLGESIKGVFYSGIKTGLDDVFIIDGEVRRQIIKQDPKSQDILPPMRKGQDLRPWYQIDGDMYLVLASKGMDIDSYPAVKSYLEQYKEDLAKRSDIADGKGEWFELRSCDYYDEFSQPKILWSMISKLPRFSISTDTLYINNSCYMLVDREEVLLPILGLLQSRVTWFCISQFVMPLRLRGGLWQYKLLTQYVERIPIPQLTVQQESDIASITEEISTLARSRYQMHDEVRQQLSTDFARKEPINSRVSLYQWWEFDNINALAEEIHTRYKVKFPPKLQDEWVRLLAKKKAEHRALTQQIIELEIRLNDIAYAAFNIAPEERQLIEETTKYPYGAV